MRLKLTLAAGTTVLGRADRPGMGSAAHSAPASSVGRLAVAGRLEGVGRTTTRSYFHGDMNVTYSDMTDAAKRLDAGKNDIIGKLNEPKALVGQLVGSGFVTDAASGAFNTSYEQFDKGTQQAVNGLDGMSQFLNSAATAMQNTDQELAKGIGG